MQHYPEALSSRSQGLRVLPEPEPRREAARPLVPVTLPPVESISTSGTLRSVVQPAPPPGSRSRLILGLFLGGILGGALLAWPRARRELAPAASPEPSLRDVVPSEVARTPEPPPAASSVRVGAEPVVSVLPAVVPAKVRPGSPPLASAVPASSKSAAPTTTETLQDGAPVRVTISTPGGEAQVYWRGESRGRTPCTLLMPPGRHTVELEPSGGPRRAVSVVARAGEPTYVSVPMERLLTAP